MKKWIKGIVAAVVAIGVLIGGLFTYQNMKDKDKTAEVHSVANMNYGWMGEDMTSSGMVISRETQEYFRTGEQMVTQVFVTPGQQVNAGDALFAYDVETQRLAVELKQIEVNNEEKHIQDLYKEINEIRAMKPYVPRPTPEPT
ncbi:MAG: biotin/lipoyl-binding protein, partial [Solobacterium sp.]|nr:biotin/lipoyl-binding protein [Solobacterium sp.]